MRIFLVLFFSLFSSLLFSNEFKYTCISGVSRGEISTQNFLFNIKEKRITTINSISGGEEYILNQVEDILRWDYPLIWTASWDDEEGYYFAKFDLKENSMIDFSFGYESSKWHCVIK
tara:strand:- start:23 stop:373 length:351 start_codon:yes stop_codon:yes gene_type:complete